MTRIRPTAIRRNCSIPWPRPTTTSCPPTARSPVTTIPRSTSAANATIMPGRRGPIPPARRIPRRNTTCCWEPLANWTPRAPHYQPGSHAILLTNQCVECHMQTTPYVSARPCRATPATVHGGFAYEMCVVPCDQSAAPSRWRNSPRRAVSNRVQELKFDLDYWATN